MKKINLLILSGILMFFISCQSKPKKFVNHVCDCFKNYSSIEDLKKASKSDKNEIKECTKKVENDVQEYVKTLNDNEKEKFNQEMEKLGKDCKCSQILNSNPNEILEETEIENDNSSNASSDNSSVVDNSSSTEATSSSTDCDKFIKNYEDFVNSYIKVLKKYKANPTDATILSEYTETMTKASEMQTNAGNCTDPKYSTKLMKLAAKMSQAAAEIMKK